MRTRKRFGTTRLSQEERLLAEAAAAREGVTALSTFIRCAIVERARRVLDLQPDEAPTTRTGSG